MEGFCLLVADWLLARDVLSAIFKCHLKGRLKGIYTRREQSVTYYVFCLSYLIREVGKQFRAEQKLTEVPRPR